MSPISSITNTALPNTRTKKTHSLARACESILSLEKISNA